MRNDINEKRGMILLLKPHDVKLYLIESLSKTLNYAISLNMPNSTITSKRLLNQQFYLKIIFFNLFEKISII